MLEAFLLEAFLLEAFLLEAFLLEAFLLVLPSSVIDGARRRLRDGHLRAAFVTRRSATAIAA
ncbi:MAG: hypothetical protein U0353_06905 [Sandaracinus sp.]